MKTEKVRSLSLMITELSRRTGSNNFSRSSRRGLKGCVVKVGQIVIRMRLSWEQKNSRRHCGIL